MGAPGALTGIDDANALRTSIRGPAVFSGPPVYTHSLLPLFPSRGPVLPRADSGRRGRTGRSMVGLRTEPDGRRASVCWLVPHAHVEAAPGVQRGASREGARGVAGLSKLAMLKSLVPAAEPLSCADPLMAPTASTLGSPRKRRAPPRADARLVEREPVAQRHEVRMAVGSPPNPGSTACTCWKVRSTTAAPTKTTGEILSCAMTSASPHRR